MLWIKRLEKIKQLAEKEQPTFNPALNPYTEKLIKSKLKDHSVNRQTKSNLSYIAAREELRDRLNASQDLKGKFPNSRSRSKSSLLGTTSSSGNLRKESDAFLKQAEFSSVSNPQPKLLEASESKKTLTDDELIAVLKEMRKTLGLDEDPQEHQEQEEQASQPLNTSENTKTNQGFEFDLSVIDQNLMKLQEALKNTRAGKNNDILQEIGESRIVEESGVEGFESNNTSMQLSMAESSARRGSEREKQNGNQRMSDDKIRDMSYIRKKNSQRVSAVPANRHKSAQIGENFNKPGSNKRESGSLYSEFFEDGDSRQSESKRTSSAFRTDQNESMEESQQDQGDLNQSQTNNSQDKSKQLRHKRSTDSRKQASKQKNRGSVYPDSEMFHEGENKKSSLSNDNSRSKTSNKSRKAHESDSKSKGKDSRRNQDERNKSRSPDSKGSEDSHRNSSADNSEGSKSRKNSNSRIKKTSKEKPRNSVYPDESLFGDEHEEDQGADSKGIARERAGSSSQDTRERASSNPQETRGRANSVPRDKSLEGRASLAESNQDMFDINEEEEYSPGSNDSAKNQHTNPRKSTTNQKNSKSSKQRESIDPDKGMLAEKGTRKPKSRDSVYPDKGLFQERGPTKARNKQRDSVYPDNSMYDYDEKDGTQSRKSSKGSVNRERGASSDENAGKDGSQQDLSNTEEISAGKKGPSKKSKEKNRESVYPDQKMFEERGTRKPKSRDSVYADKGLFQKKDPTKARNKPRDSVYPDNSMYDHDERDGTRSRKSSKGSVNRERGVSSDQNAGKDGSQQDLSNSEDMSASKKGPSKKSKEKNRESVYPDQKMFEEKESKKPKNKSRDSVSPEQRMFNESASSKKKNKGRDSVYPDKHLFQERGPAKNRNKQRESVYPGNDIYDERDENNSRKSRTSRNKEHEVSSDRNVNIHDSSKVEISRSEEVSIDKQGTKQTKEKQRGSVYPDQEMYSEGHSENLHQQRNNTDHTKENKSDQSRNRNRDSVYPKKDMYNAKDTQRQKNNRDSVYPGEEIFAERDSKRDKNKQRGSEYPDAHLFEDGSHEKDTSEVKNDKKPTKNRQKDSGSRGSVYPEHDLFNAGEDHDEGDDLTNRERSESARRNRAESKARKSNLEQIPEEDAKDDISKALNEDDHRDAQRRNTNSSKNQQPPLELKERDDREEEEEQEHNDYANLKDDKNEKGRGTKSTKGKLPRRAKGRSNYKNPARPKRFQTPDPDSNSSKEASVERDQQKISKKQNPSNKQDASSTKGEDRDEKRISQMQEPTEQYQAIEEEEKFIQSKAHPDQGEENLKEDSFVNPHERRHQEKEKMREREHGSMRQEEEERIRQAEEERIRRAEEERIRQEEAERVRQIEAEKMRQMETQNEIIQQTLALTELKAKNLEEELKKVVGNRDSRRSKVRIDFADGYSYSPEEPRPLTKRKSEYEAISVPNSELFKIELFNKEIREAPKENQTLKALGTSTKTKYVNYQIERIKGGEELPTHPNDTLRSGRVIRYERPDSPGQPQGSREAEPHRRTSILKKELTTPQKLNPNARRNSAFNTTLKFTKSSSHFFK